MNVFNLLDTYTMDFSIDAELEDITGYDGVRASFPRANHYLFSVRSKFGGVFEMRTRPDGFGQYATFVQGEHKQSVLHDLMDEANHARKTAGNVEKYGDHLADCMMKDLEWLPAYEDDEPRCTCGFEHALHLDEEFQRRNYVKSVD